MKTILLTTILVILSITSIASCKTAPTQREPDVSDIVETAVAQEAANMLLDR